MTRPMLGLWAWQPVANEWAELLLLSSSGFQTGPITLFPAITRNKNGLTQNGPSSIMPYTAFSLSVAESFQRLIFEKK